MEIHRPSQENRILAVLDSGDWINGRIFIQEMRISQAHARLFSLKRKGHRIEASTFTDDHGFKSYRLVQGDPEQTQLI